MGVRQRIMKKAIKTLIAVLLLVCMAFQAGCSSSGVPHHEDGKIPILKLKELPDAGYFVRKNNDYLPLYRLGRSFTASPKDTLEGRYLVISKTEALIPVVTAEDEIIYRNVSALPPSRYIFEGMKDAGYTVGLQFIYDNKLDKAKLKQRQEMPANSTGAVLYKEIENVSLTLFETINTIKLEQGLIDSNGFIANLEEGQKYMFGAFRGTVYEEYTVIADTRYFVSNYTRIVEDGVPAYSTTRSGYVVITMPDGLNEGLYAINGAGCFYYQP